MKPVYPPRVSEDRRYFVDQNGAPVFWLGTTQWELFRGYPREDARTILAARHPDGRWIMVYVADPASVSVDLRHIAGGEVEARWIDPRTGEPTAAGRFSNTGVRPFSTPAGWEDALLLLEASDG